MSKIDAASKIVRSAWSWHGWNVYVSYVRGKVGHCIYIYLYIGLFWHIYRSLLAFDMVDTMSKIDAANKMARSAWSWHGWSANISYVRGKVSHYIYLSLFIGLFWHTHGSLLISKIDAASKMARSSWSWHGWNVYILYFRGKVVYSIYIHLYIGLFWHTYRSLLTSRIDAASKMARSARSEHGWNAYISYVRGKMGHYI